MEFRESTSEVKDEEKFRVADDTLHVEPQHGKDDQKWLIKHLKGETLKKFMEFPIILPLTFKGITI